MDDLVPDLLVLPPGIDLHDHHLVKDGSVLRQVLDACSAPRNKTVHLAALMRGEGKIIAYELDNEKVKWKECTIKQDGSTNVEVLHEDFLKLSPVDLSYSKDKVIGILDWELSTLGNQMFDVAYSTLVIISVNCETFMHYKLTNIYPIVYFVHHLVCYLLCYSIIMQNFSFENICIGQTTLQKGELQRNEYAILLCSQRCSRFFSTLVKPVVYFSTLECG